MFTEIVICVILVLMGAGIAYLGDWIGFSMGKRRLSVFGLRPRHTARVFTAASGAVIAVATFLIVMGIVPQVRIAIREGAQIIRRNHVLAAETRRLKAQSNAEIAAEQAALAAEGKARADTAAAIVDRDKAETQYRADKKTLALDNIAIAQAGVKLGAVNQQLYAATESLNAARIRLAQAQARSAELNKETVFDESYVDTNVVRPMKQNALVYENGQEVMRTVIRSDQKVEEIKQQIRGFLLRLSVESQGRGSARGPNGRFVEITPVKLLTPKPKLYNEAASVDALADQINANKRSDSVVVIAYASANAFSGEQADIMLIPYANYLAVRKGKVLGDIVIPVADDNPGEVLTELRRLLQRARDSAIDAGVIPVKDPQSKEPEVGQTNISDLFAVIDQVRAIKGPATVTAAATRDTYSADSLSLAFSVQSGSHASSTASGT